jgi:hypothetical protein
LVLLLQLHEVADALMADALEGCDCAASASVRKWLQVHWSQLLLLLPLMLPPAARPPALAPLSLAAPLQQVWLVHWTHQQLASQRFASCAC